MPPYTLSVRQEICSARDHVQESHVAAACPGTEASLASFLEPLLVNGG